MQKKTNVLSIKTVILIFHYKIICFVTFMFVFYQNNFYEKQPSRRRAIKKTKTKSYFPLVPFRRKAVLSGHPARGPTCYRRISCLCVQLAYPRVGGGARGTEGGGDHQRPIRCNQRSSAIKAACASPQSVHCSLLVCYARLSGFFASTEPLRERYGITFIRFVSKL